MRIRPRFVVVFVGSASLFPVTAAAQSTICADSYEKAQEEKAAGHLKAALVHLKSCIDPTCPKFIRDDCVRWMDQTESALPSVVFAARREGEDLTDVEVFCDGEPLMKSLDGKAVSLDPGPTTSRLVFRASRPSNGRRSFGRASKIESSPSSSASRARAPHCRRRPPARTSLSRLSPPNQDGHALLAVRAGEPWRAGVAGFALFASREQSEGRSGAYLLAPLSIEPGGRSENEVSARRHMPGGGPGFGWCRDLSVPDEAWRRYGRPGPRDFSRLCSSNIRAGGVVQVLTSF